MKKAIKIISVALCVASCFVSLGMGMGTLPIFASATTDTGFKHLMADLKIAQSIINAVVPDFRSSPIQLLEARSVFIPQLRADWQMQVAMDFFAVTQRNEHIVIEMQVVRLRHIMFDESALFYASPTYSGQLADKNFTLKEWYTKLKKVYAIQIFDYDTERASGINSKDTKTIDTLIIRKANNPMLDNQSVKHFLLMDKQSGQIINYLQIVQIELPRADRLMHLGPNNVNNKNELEWWWLSLLKNSSIYSDVTSDKEVPECVLQGFNSLRLADWKQEDKTEYIKEFSYNLYAANVQDKIQQALNKLQPQIEKLLAKQIRQNYRKFKDALGKSSDGKVSFNPLKFLTNVNIEKIQAALTNYKQEDAYVSFIDFVQTIGTLSEIGMKHDSYGNV